MRPVYLYIAAALGLTLILMFFIYEHSRQFKTGYELTQLRRERDTIKKESRELDLEIAQKMSYRSLWETALRLRVNLQPPMATAPK